MRSRSLLALLLTFGFIGGCVRTIHPILEDGQVIVDNSIAGKWVDQKGKTSADVAQADENKNYKVVYIDEDGKKGVFRARIGKIGEMKVAELTPDDPAPGASDIYKAHLLPLYSFLVIRQTKPQLIVVTMEQSWLSKYLDDHPNELQIAHVDKDNLVVTSSTADFQAFLIHHSKDEGALKQEVTYVRPGDPTTQATAPEPPK